MIEMRYKHLVEYDLEENKIIISRMLESGKVHLYTEIPINELDVSKRTLEALGRMLGEAIILDMNQFRDQVI